MRISYKIIKYEFDCPAPAWLRRFNRRSMNRERSRVRAQPVLAHPQNSEGERENSRIFMCGMTVQPVIFFRAATVYFVGFVVVSSAATVVM
jgi:hypothetical protein